VHSEGKEITRENESRAENAARAKSAAGDLHGRNPKQRKKSIQTVRTSLAPKNEQRDSLAADCKPDRRGRLCLDGKWETRYKIEEHAQAKKLTLRSADTKSKIMEELTAQMRTKRETFQLKSSTITITESKMVEELTAQKLFN
jgi:hypothetical protein